MEFDIANVLVFNTVTVFPDLFNSGMNSNNSLIFKGSKTKPCPVMLDIAQIIPQGHFLQVKVFFQPFIDM